MGKVSHSVCIALLITVVNSFPLEDKPKDSPQVLIAQPPTLVNDNKDHSLSRESSFETTRPKREEPEKPHLDKPIQNENQGPTPKPVHHYRDEPIIQRRDADKSFSEESGSRQGNLESLEKNVDHPYRYEPVNERRGDESGSRTKSDEAHEKKNSEIPNRQRRDTKDENNEKDNQPTYERSNPSVLASNPNIQTPAYLPTPRSTGDSDDQKVSSISRSGSSSQYGASTRSSGVPDLIPASSTHLNPSDQNQDEKQHNLRDQQYNQQHPVEISNTQNRKITQDKETSEHQQQRKTRDLAHSQHNKATEDKHSLKNQQQQDVHENPPHLSSSHSPSSSKNRKVRDVSDSQPHLLASNPSNLNNRDDSPSSFPRSTGAAVPPPTTENTRFLNSQKVK